MRQRGALVFILLIGIATADYQAAHAQGQGGTGAYTIDELIMRALADNPELRAVRTEVDAARGRLRQAGLRPNPMLDLGAQQNVTGPDNNVTVGVTLPLDLNRRKEGRVGVAERELEMKEAQVADRERGLRADVRMKAGDLLAAQRDVRITEELLDANQKALELI